MGRFTGFGSHRTIALNRRDLEVSICILILTLSFVAIENPPALPSLVQSELIGTYFVSAYVPFFVLYDPPGNGSSSMFSRNVSDPIMVRLEGHTSSLQVVGEFTFRSSLAYAGSPTHRRDSAVIAVYLNQTWEIMRYSRLDYRWTEAHLVNCTAWGWGIFGFENLGKYGEWVVDRTGTPSNYSLDYNVTPGTLERTTVECFPASPQPIGAGFNISLMGTEVSINVLVCPQNHPFKLKYTYYGGREHLVFHLSADAPISQEPYRTDSLLLWFS